MKCVALLILAVALSAAGCGKRGAAVAPTATESTTPTSSASAWVKLGSGLEYRDIKVGTGPEVKNGDVVTVDYKGWLDNGKVFDTSKKIGCEPLSFAVGQGRVIPGWDQGIPGMKVGGERELKIPADLAYGDEEQPGIPANSTLHFTVELLKVYPATQR